MIYAIPNFLISLSIVLMSLALTALGFLPFIIHNRTISQAGRDAGGQNKEMNKIKYIEKAMYPNENIYVEHREDDVFYVRNHDGEFLVTLTLLDNGGYEEKIRPIQ